MVANGSVYGEITSSTKSAANNRVTIHRDIVGKTMDPKSDFKIGAMSTADLSEQTCEESARKNDADVVRAQRMNKFVRVVD
jgi:hypothetical protein